MKEEENIGRLICIEVKSEFPIGSVLSFQKGVSNIMLGEVVMHSYDGRNIRIINIVTNKRYWISLFHILKVSQPDRVKGGKVKAIKFRILVKMPDGIERWEEDERVIGSQDRTGK